MESSVIPTVYIFFRLYLLYITQMYLFDLLVHLMMVIL